MNGRNGPRGRGGRFVSSNDVLLAPVPPMPQCYSFVSAQQSTEGTWASICPQQLTSEHNSSNALYRPIRAAALKARNTMDMFDDSDDDWPLSLQNGTDCPLKATMQDTIAPKMQDPTHTLSSIGHSSQSSIHNGTPVMVGAEHIVREAATRGAGFYGITCKFDALVGDEVLTSFYKRANGVPKNNISSFRAYMVYQCARDRRSLGDSLLRAVSIDAPFSTDGLRMVLNGYTVVDVDSPAMREACKRLFVDTKLIMGTEDELDLDMNMFSSYPFYMLASMLGDRVHGACVFRVHSLSNGHRLLALELLASDPNDTETVGAGTALMQCLRTLSMLSPRHTGHICGGTLRTKDAREFYARQLPECNSPQARAFLVSVAFLDVNHDLKNHLDMRCTTVWPSSG